MELSNGIMLGALVKIEVVVIGGFFQSLGGCCLYFSTYREKFGGSDCQQPSWLWFWSFGKDVATEIVEDLDFPC